MSNFFGQKVLEEGTIIHPNKSLDFMKAYHYVLAYDRNFGEDIHLRLETYYQNLRRVPISPAGITDPQLRTFSSLNLESGFTTEQLVK